MIQMGNKALICTVISFRTPVLSMSVHPNVLLSYVERNLKNSLPHRYSWFQDDHPFWWFLTFHAAPTSIKNVSPNTSSSMRSQKRQIRKDNGLNILLQHHIKQILFPAKWGTDKPHKFPLPRSQYNENMLKYNSFN